MNVCLREHAAAFVLKHLDVRYRYAAAVIFLLTAPKKPALKYKQICRTTQAA
jgi:hypothetical protein